MRFVRKKSDEYQHICLLWPQISILPLPDLDTPIVNYIWFQIEPLRSIFLSCVSNKIRLNMGLLRPFYTQIGRIGWPGPDSNRGAKATLVSDKEKRKRVKVILFNKSAINSNTFLLEPVKTEIGHSRVGQAQVASTYVQSSIPVSMASKDQKHFLKPVFLISQLRK